MSSWFRSHLTFANVIACLALFIALGGTSMAAVSLRKNSVGSSQIRNGSVTSRDVKNRTLLTRDFKPGQLPRGASGPRGLSGLRGAAGARGLQGVPGVTGIHQIGPGAVALSSSPIKTESVTCPAGEKVIAPLASAQEPNGPLSGLALDAVSVSSDMRTVTVTASEDRAGISDTWFVLPGAICAKF